MDKLVEIIIPVYNKEETINKCIDSILQQTYSNFSVIIVDDGSTDKSYEICSKYKDKRIRLIKQQNMGVSAARNTGIKYLTGDKVVFVDADDFVNPTYIMDMLKYSDYDLVVTGYRRYYLDRCKYKTFIPNKRCVSSCDYENVLFDINFFKFITMPWNKMFDTSIIKEHGLQFRNINLGEDICFSFDYIQFADNVIFIPDANYNYVESIGSLTGTDIPDVWERQKDINDYCRKKYYKKYGETWTNMYVRAIKRTLGEAVENRSKFKRQIKIINSDCDFQKVKIKNISGLINRIIFYFVKIKNVFLLRIMFLFT